MLFLLLFVVGYNKLTLSSFKKYWHDIGHIVKSHWVIFVLLIWWINIFICCLFERHAMNIEMHSRAHFPPPISHCFFAHHPLSFFQFHSVSYSLLVSRTKINQQLLFIRFDGAHNVVIPITVATSNGNGKWFSLFQCCFCLFLSWTASRCQCVQKKKKK